VSDPRLPALARIAGAVLDAELAELRARGAAAEAARGRIASLDAAVARQHAVIAAELEAPVAGPVLDRWGGWADRRRAELNAALTRELAALEAQRQAAAQAFGRAEALRLVAARTEAEARRKARRAGSTGR
jgi:hypothetical protein